jgi:hypothetical protein
LVKEKNESCMNMKGGEERYGCTTYIRSFFSTYH